MPAPQAAVPQLQQGVAGRPARQPFHVWGFLFSLLLWFGLLCLLSSLASPASTLPSGRPPLSDSAVAVFALLLAIPYLINSFRSATLKYLWHLNPVEDVVMYIQARRESPPQLGFNCECSHLEWRTRNVTESYTDMESQYDSTSKSYRYVPVVKTRQKTESYQERVVTWRAREDFEFSQWEDVSPALTEDIYRYQAVKLDFSFYAEFGDRQTEAAYHEAKQQFIQEHQNRDANFDFWEYCWVADLQERMLSIVDLKKKSVLLHWFAYVVATLVGLSWPYRLWFEHQTVPGAFQFRKQIVV